MNFTNMIYVHLIDNDYEILLPLVLLLLNPNFVIIIKKQ